MPLAAIGLPPSGQPIAVAMLTVGIHDFFGAGRVGRRAKALFGRGGILRVVAAREGQRQRAMHVVSQKILAHDRSLQIAH